MRLGDDVDDYCSRCKRTTDHSVLALVGDDVMKVRCRTCNNEHKFRNNKSGKKELTNAQAFDKVLESVTGDVAAQKSKS
jgi:ribosomal protein L44E